MKKVKISGRKRNGRIRDTGGVYMRNCTSETADTVSCGMLGDFVTVNWRDKP